VKTKERLIAFDIYIVLVIQGEKDENAEQSNKAVYGSHRKNRKKTWN